MHVDSEVGRECKKVSESMKVTTKRCNTYIQMRAHTSRCATWFPNALTVRLCLVVMNM